MKRFLIVFSLLLVLSPLSTTYAAVSLSDSFIAITDMKTAIQDHDAAAYNKHLAELKQGYASLPKGKDKTLEQKIEQQINVLETEKSSTTRLDSLQTLSKDLVRYEKVLNPEDKNKKRQALKNALYPVIKDMKAAIENNDIKQAMRDNKTLNTVWTANEKIVRSEDIGRYGQIETALMMTRIELSKDTPNKDGALKQLDQLTTELDDYLAGKKAEKVQDKDATILSTYLSDAIQQIDDHQIDAAKATLSQFVVDWPNVEGDIRNSNAALYSKIEQKIPDYAGSLNEQNKEDIKKNLTLINTEIKQAVSKDHYTFIDAALILLREGVEALLIIMALLSVTKKAGQRKATGWIIAGSVLGLLASAILAVIFNQLFQNIGQGRELIEAVVGLCAVILMIFIGTWLHSKSSSANWQKFINKNMSQALTTGSVLTFSFVSFLSVFREGAETLIFYAGIAGKISLSQLIIGIMIALVILLIIAIFFDKITAVIPIRQLFFIMSLFIFLLSFKILGVSIHTFQVLGMIPTTTISHLPFVPLIGFYPTVETSVAQLILIIGVAIYFIYTRKKHSKVNATA